MKPTKIDNITLEEFLYYAVFSILLFIKGIGLDEGNLFFRLCLVVAMSLFAVKILIGEYTLLELAVIGIGILWGVFLFFNMGSFGILIYMMMLLGMKNISVDKTMKVGLAVWSVCMFTTVTAGIFFERYGVRVVHEKFGLGPLLRESLGYGHPNVLHITYILLMVFVLYCCREEKSIKAILLLIAGNLFIFLYSMSYTGLLFSMALIIGYLYFYYRKKRTILEDGLIQLILPSCIIFTVIVVPFIDFHGKLYRFLNTLLNNRLFIIKRFFGEFDLTLFGERIYKDNLSLDNSYLYALGWYGVVFFVVAMAAYLLLIHHYVKENRRKELAILCAFLIGGLTEQFLFNGSIKNITVIFLGEAFFRFAKNRGKELSLVKGGSVSQVELHLPLEWFERGSRFIGICFRPKTIIIYLIVLAAAIPAAFLIPMQKVETVYVNEKHCHYYEETVRAEEIEDGPTVVVIGDRSEGQNFHYFTRENSNLIQFSEVRHRISVGVYIAAGITVVGILIRVRTGKNNHDETL